MQYLRERSCPDHKPGEGDRAVTGLTDREKGHWCQDRAAGRAAARAVSTQLVVRVSRAVPIYLREEIPPIHLLVRRLGGDRS